MIHVSDLLNYKRCPKYCWNNVHRKHPFEGFYHMEKPFSDYWKEYLNIQNAPCGQVGDANEDTLNLLKIVMQYVQFVLSIEIVVPGFLF